MHVIDVIGDGGGGRRDPAGGGHAHAHGGDDQRGAEGEGRQRQACDGGHAPHRRGGAPRDAGDLGLLVDRADVLGDGVQPDDGLPQHLGPLGEHLVEEPQATLDLVGQDGEGPGG